MQALNISKEAADADLIAAVLEGSETAFGHLLERYQERVFRLLSRFTRDWAETEDLAQEVFVKVFRKLHTFQQDSAFYTWLYRITVNTATDQMARRKRRRLHLVEDNTSLDRGEPESGHGGAAQPLMEQEVREVTRTVLDKLPEKYRRILILREYEDLSYTEMAEVLGCSIGTVESRLFRARKRFKEALERSYPDLVPHYRGGGS
jgi:RNA polymerase sigma-70 factor (ECF subfamily)